MTDGPDGLLRILPVSRETIERLEAYRDLLKVWQSKTNLVGPGTADLFWSRHVADAAFIYKCGSMERRWLDVGSGAGFPGLVIAAFLTEREAPSNVVSVEANAKKCAFQRAAVLAMGLRGGNVTVHIRQQRIEDVPQFEHRTVVTARAFASLADILDHADRLGNGVERLLLPKGRAYKDEIAAAQERFTFDFETVPHPTTPDSVLLDIRSFRRSI